MNYYIDSGESGVSSISSSPRSTASMRDDREFSLEEIDSSYGLSSSPEACPPRRSIVIREEEDIKLGICRKDDEPIRYYCNDCRVNICENCVLEDHDSCVTELLRSYILKLCETSLEKDMGELNAKSENLQNIRTAFDSKLNDIKKKIDVIADGIIEDIERKRFNLKRKIRLAEMYRHDTWSQQLELCHRSINKLKYHLRRLKRLDLEDINAIRKNIMAEVGDGLDFIDEGEIKVEFEDFPAFDIGVMKAPPCPGKSTVILPETSFSHRYNTCTVLILNIFEEVSDGEYNLTASMHDVDFNSVYLTIQNEKAGIYKMSYYPTKQGQHLLYVYVDSIAIGSSPYKFNVIFEESEHIPRCCFTIDGSGEGKLSRPWGICADFRGRILVADRGNNCVKIFTEEGTYVHAFGKTGSGPGEFLRPTGIAVDHILQRIIVADKDNHRIQIFNLKGNYLREFGSHGEKNGQFIYPWDVSVSESSLIAVTDSKNRRIQLFNHIGGFIRKFSFHVKQMPDIELPRGLIFRSDGSLMITDFNKHKIISLDESLESPREFGSEGCELAQFFRPQSIDVDRFGRFAVADCKNNRIQVFEPNGKLYCAFGSQGSKRGELDSPQGLCFLSNGHIAVVELNSTRIQVFKLPN